VKFNALQCKGNNSHTEEIICNENSKRHSASDESFKGCLSDTEQSKVVKSTSKETGTTSRTAEILHKEIATSKKAQLPFSTSQFNS
jgi:hypothetical protein